MHDLSLCKLALGFVRSALFLIVNFELLALAANERHLNSRAVIAVVRWCWWFCVQYIVYSINLLVRCGGNVRRE